MYCDPINSGKRKSTLILLNVILNSLIRWFAPILSFTTEEIYQLISKNKKSIHLEKFLKFPEKFYNSNLNSKWEQLIRIRDICNLSIEQKRASKDIGSSLEAALIVRLNNDNQKFLKNIDLSELCITSSVKIENSDTTDITVETKKATGEKCPICWKIRSAPCERPNCK